MTNLNSYYVVYRTQGQVCFVKFEMSHSNLSADELFGKIFGIVEAKVISEWGSGTKPEFVITNIVNLNQTFGIK